MLSDSEKRQLDECGYLVLPGLMGPELLREVRDRIDGTLRAGRRRGRDRNSSRSPTRGAWRTWSIKVRSSSG